MIIEYFNTMECKNVKKISYIETIYRYLFTTYSPDQLYASASPSPFVPLL